MCIGIPGKVTEIKNNRAKVKQKGHFHWLDLAMIEQKISVGDYLLSYQGFAINRITPSEAKKALEILKKLKNDKY